MMDFNERLAIARKRAGYDGPTEAANAFGWNENSYRSHENGHRVPRRDTLARYAQAFGVTVGYLLNGEGADPGEKPYQPKHHPSRDVPLIRWETFLNINSIGLSKLTETGPLVSVPALPDLGAQLLCVYVSDDSMTAPPGQSPSFEKGDLLVVSLEAPIKPGDFVVAIVGDEPMLRRYADRGNGVFDLSPLNPNFATIRVADAAEGRIVGRAMQRIEVL